MKKIYLNRYHFIMEIICHVLNLLSFVIAIVGFVFLPDQIPSHFDLAGNVTDYGSKSILFLMPGLMLATEIIISITLHFVRERYWNVPKAKHPENQILVYREAASMVVELMVIFAVYNLFFELVMVISSGQSTTGLVTILMLLVLFVDVAIRVIKMYRY